MASASMSPAPQRLRSAVIAGLMVGALGGLAPSPARAVDESPPAILQWFDSSYRTIERRTGDAFLAGYGAVWTPPPGRADLSNFSVGYDVYDRFELGAPNNPTLYGTETGIKTVASTLHRAGLDFHVDFVMNHNGYSGTGDAASRQAFKNAGGYPGFFLDRPGDADGDFHGAFESGDIKGRLAGLIDIAQEKNHTAVRNPVPGFANNIPAGTVPQFGRLANVAREENRRFYPDRSLQPMFLFDPKTGEQNIPVYPFNNANPMAGDPVAENALGYLMRNAQWLVQEVGVDGLRLDAAKHVERFTLEFIDRAVYRSNPRLLLDGSTKHVFSYGEVFDGDDATLLSYVRKDINPADPGRIGGNRDVLDFKLYFNLKANLESPGTPDAWQKITRRYNPNGGADDYGGSLDLYDDNLNNGSVGLKFVHNHDVFKPFSLDNVAHAYTLMMPGNATVYFNGKEFGDNRDFPKEGRDDALSVKNGSPLTRLLDIRNTHGRGNYAERWIDNQGLFSFERGGSAITLLSNRGDGGFDSRTLTHVGFAAGTHLIELTGNASDPAVDSNNQIPEVVTVFNEGGVNKVNVRFPRNRAANGTWHGRGYAIYGLPTPQAGPGLQLSNVSQVLAGDGTPNNNYENGTQRQADVHVLTGNTTRVKLQTNEVRLLGSDALRDVWADGDNALLKADGGRDTNGSGQVDFRAPGSVVYGFESFGTKSSPLIGPQGINGPRGDGEFLQDLNLTQFEEGYHYLEARAFRHRTDGGPAVYSSFKKVIYVDRLKPVSEVASFVPYQQAVSHNRELRIRSTDLTADSVHVFLDVPASVTESQILSWVGAGNKAGPIDRDLYAYGFSNLTHGNHVATVVTYEMTGNHNVQRIPGLFTDTIIGAGLGDVNFNGAYSPLDVQIFAGLVQSANTSFNPAADFDANGLITFTDWKLFGLLLKTADVGRPTVRAYEDFSRTVPEPGAVVLLGVVVAWGACLRRRG